MSREFENPANKHREEINGSANLLALCFGMFYFLAKGVWRHAAIQVLVCAFFFLGLGLLGSVLAVFMWIGYAVFAQDVMAAEYLRRGWREIGFGADGDRPIWWGGIPDKGDPLVGNVAPGVLPQNGSLKDMKACPYCAEPIRSAAVKCRYCGSDVSLIGNSPSGLSAP